MTSNSDFDEAWKKMHTPCKSSLKYKVTNTETGGSRIQSFTEFQLEKAGIPNPTNPSVSMLQSLVASWNRQGRGVWEYALV